MAQPTWDELRPKDALLREAEERVRAADREEQRIRRDALRQGPPGWLYDPEGRQWTYRSAAGEATLSWLRPDDYGGGEWRFGFKRADGMAGGGSLSPIATEKAMAQVVEWLEKGTWSDAS
jgi:hypothetical protein